MGLIKSFKYIGTIYKTMFYTLVSRSIITKINTPRDYLYIFLIGSIGYVILHWYLHMDKCEGFLEKIREYLYYAMVVDAITAYALMLMYPPNSKQNTREKTSSENESADAERKGKNEPQYTQEQSKAIIQNMQEARRLQQMRQRAIAEQKGQATQSGDKSSPNQNQTNSPVSNENKHNEPDKENKNKEGCDKNKEKDNKNNKEANESGKKSIFTKSEESKEVTDTATDSNDGIQTAPKIKENTDTDDKKNTKSNLKSKESKNNKSDVRVKGKKKESEIADTEIPIFEGQKSN